MTAPIEAIQAGLAPRYLVEGELGRGGMATVFAAVDRQQHRPVAIKMLHPGIAAAIGIDRFEREIATTMGLVHPHIVPVLDSGVIGTGSASQPYYVMPRIEGESLRLRLERTGPLPVSQAVEIVRDVGSALEFAHRHGVIHRDVKPENVLLIGEQALLADFGIARPVSPDERTRLTSTGLVLGTPSYMSPEQLAGGAVDARSDLYSLAVTAYELVAGRLPFEGGDPRQALAQRFSGDLRRTGGTAGLPAALEAVLHRALAADPDDRFPSVGEFLRALGEVTADERTGGRADRTRRRRWLMTGAGAVAIAIAVWLGGRPDGGGDPRLGIAIMPFRVSAGLEQLGETLPDLVATLLAGTPRLRIADPWALWRPLRASPQDRARSPDPEEAVRIAARSRARRVVLGRIDQDRAGLNLTVRIYGAGVGEPVAQFTISAPVDSTAGLARQAAVEVLANVWEGTDPAPAAGLAEAPLTQSPEALKAYLEAREAMRRGQPDSANIAITRAIALDSTFALALIEAINVQSWVQSLRGQPFAGLRELIQRVRPYRDRLPERHQLRLAASEASIETDGPAAAAAWRRLIELDSTDAGAWNGLAYVNLAYGWQFGVTAEAIQATADRAVELDSTYIPARFRRAQLVPELGDPDAVRREIASLRAIEAGSPLLRGSRAGLEALVMPDSGFLAGLDSIAALSPIEWGSVFRRLRAYRPDRALALARRTLATEGPGFKRTLAASGQVGLLAAAGAWEALDSLGAAGTFAAIPELGPAVDLKRVLAAIWGELDPSGLETTIGALETREPVDSALAGYQRRDLWRTGWVIAAYHASLGDTAIARRWREVFAAIPPSGSPATWAAAEAADLGARLAARRGQSDSVGPLTHRALALWTIHTENASDHEPEPAFRFAAARVLAAAGLRDSAESLYRSLVIPHTWLGGYTVRSLVALGELAAGRGDRAGAARFFDRALQHLELGGERVRAQRERVSAALAATGMAPPPRFGSPPRSR